MNKATEQRFADIIAKRNTETYIKRKIFVSFSLLMLLGITCGFAFFDAVYRNVSQDASHAVYHFGKVFEGCETYSDHFSVVLGVSRADIRILFFIFISGFTYFCYPASGAMVLSKGFLSGFAVFYLAEVLNKTEISYAPLAFWTFVAFRAVLCVITLHLAMSSYMFSYKFREIKQSSSVLRRAPITYKYAFVFVYSVGGVLMANYAYCFLIYILK